MADSATKAPKFGLRRLYRLFGIYTPAEMPKQNEKTDIQFTNYTPDELRHVAGFSQDPMDNKGPRSTAELDQYLKSVAGENQNTIREISSLNILSPEIPAARQIMVGSIMSPTDLQTESINVIVDNTDFGEQVETDISRVCNDFFNNDMNLGERVSQWIGDALFETGASAILVLPQHNIDLLNNSIDVQFNKTYGDKKIKPGEEHITCSLESILPVKQEEKNEFFLYSDKFDDLDDANIIDAVVTQISTEAADIFKNVADSEIHSHAKDTSSMVKQLLKNKRSSIIVSSDARIIKSSESRLQKNINKMTEEISKNFLFDGMNPTMILSTEMDDTANNTASLIEIPATAIVPIIVPGTPHKHLGYFILVDQWGTPLVENRYDPGVWQGSRKLTDSNMQASFGRSSAITLSGEMGDKQRYEMTSRVFGLTVKNMMESKLDELGLNGVSITDHEAITNCMFRQLIDKKKVGLIFVPESLMVYYCFDHHADGTGKSIIEDMKTLLSLRTTLLISYIMAATENSVDHKTIEVDVDEKQANLEQFLDMINQTMVEKKMLRFDNNPQAVMRDLTQKAVTILPKGIKGLQNSLNVTTEHRSNGSVMPDDNLIEKLSKWVVAFTQVPAAALNQLGEGEYSRSVATTNLFFSNNIKAKQKVTNEHTTKLVRLVLMFNAPLRKKLKDILGSIASNEEDVNAQSSTEATKVTGQEVEKNDDTVNKNLSKIIQNIRTTLPQPKIVVDKAQYNEIKDYIDSIDKLIGDLYADDLLGTQSGNYGETNKMLRAIVKAQMLRDYIDNIGFQSTFELPLPDQIDASTSQDHLLRLINLKKRFDDIQAQIVDKLNSSDAPEETPGDGSSGDSSGVDNNDNPDDAIPTDEGENNDDQPPGGSIW